MALLRQCDVCKQEDLVRYYMKEDKMICYDCWEKLHPQEAKLKRLERTFDEMSVMLVHMGNLVKEMKKRLKKRAQNEHTRWVQCCYALQ